jgi:hypothetical protein
MALIGVQPVQNPGLAHPPREQREKKSDLDKVLEGLNIANSAMGIAVNYEHINNYMKQNDALDQTAAGVLPAKDRLDAQVHGMQPVPEGTPGSQLHKFSSDDPGGFSKQAFIMPQKAETPMGQFIKTADPATGKPLMQWVDKGAGSVPAYEEPKTPKEPVAHYTTLADSTGKLYKTNTLTGEVTPVDTGDAKFGKAGGGGADKANSAQEKIYSDAYKEARTAKGEPGVQQAMKALVNVGNADRIISKYVTPDMTPEQQVAALDKMTPQEASFLTAEIGKIASGGVAGEHTMNSMSAHTLDSGWAEFKQKISGTPKGAELGAFILNNKGYLDELRQANQDVVDQHVNSVFKENENRFTPAQQDRWKQDTNFARLFKTGKTEKPAAAVAGNTGTGTAQAAPASPPAPHPEDSAAVKWAGQNRLSKDPETAAKAIEILRLNGK